MVAMLDVSRFHGEAGAVSDSERGTYPQCADLEHLVLIGSPGVLLTQEAHVNEWCRPARRHAINRLRHHEQVFTL